MLKDDDSSILEIYEDLEKLTSIAVGSDIAWLLQFRTSTLKTGSIS